MTVPENSYTIRPPSQEQPPRIFTGWPGLGRVLEFESQMVAMQLGWVLIGRLLQGFLEWPAAVARTAGASVLRCRLTGLGVSLLVHTPLVWVLSALAPVPLPIEVGLDSVVAVQARRQPVASAQVVLTDIPVQLDPTSESGPSDQRQLLAAELRAPVTPSGPPVPRTADMDSHLQRVLSPARPRPEKDLPALIWPRQLTVSELARQFTSDTHEMPQSDSTVQAAGERELAARPRTEPMPDQNPASGDERMADSPSPARQRPVENSNKPSATATTPKLQKRSAPRKHRTQVKQQDEPKPPQPDVTQTQQLAQDRDSVASQQSSGQLVRRLPQKLPRNPQPVYPADAWRAGREGRVVLQVRVDVQGRVHDLRVRTSSGTRALDQAALDAVARWKFRPALRGQQPVEHQILIPISFRIER